MPCRFEEVAVVLKAAKGQIGGMTNFLKKIRSPNGKEEDYFQNPQGLRILRRTGNMDNLCLKNIASSSFDMSQRGDEIRKGLKNY